MANSLIQFRIDEETRSQAILICEKIGIDLQTYLRMSLKRLVSQKDLPFIALNIQEDSSFIKAIKACQSEAKQNGTSEMTLDEINDEINEARKDPR